jgi:hypothetical protein
MGAVPVQTILGLPVQQVLQIAVAVAAVLMVMLRLGRFLPVVTVVLV